jgi:oligopeptide/dipeptide ABC transporter ATP-binding protein
MSSTIGVMYQGRIVELGSRERLFSSPRHPCTHALLASIPSPERTPASHAIVREEPATATAEVSGCRFHPRCPLGERELCRTVEPSLDPLAPDHRAACHYPQSAESLARESASAPA